MEKTTPEQIIKAFDDCVCFFWGSAREYVNRHDAKHAQEWIARGATMTICVLVFSRQLEKIYHDEKSAPTSIGYIGDDVMAAIDRMNGKVIDDIEKDISRWRFRLRAFQEKGIWHEFWGDKPPRNIMIPRSLLTEFGWAAARTSK